MRTSPFVLKHGKLLLEGLDNLLTIWFNNGDSRLKKAARKLGQRHYYHLRQFGMLTPHIWANVPVIICDTMAPFFNDVLGSKNTDEVHTAWEAFADYLVDLMQQGASKEFRHNPLPLLNRRASQKVTRTGNNPDQLSIISTELD